MGGPLLSAALIVRNEERFLEGCLRSIRELVDEIVVVDTGSTDRSPEIARACGARLHDFTWRDDFAAARNHALDLARGAWILYIDADERARPCAVPELRAQLGDPAHVAYYVLLHARPGLTPYRELRLFRNHPMIRFRGIIHETMWPGIHAYRAATRGARIGRSGLVLDHEGYEGDQQHKHARNLPLLSRALRQDPTRIFSWCHVASICLALGKETVADRAWGIALRLVRAKRGRDLLPEDSLPYISLIQRRAAAGRDVESLLAEALRRFPRNLQLQWQRGRALMAAGRFDDAVPVFERLIDYGETGRFDYSMGYDRGLFSVLSYEALATCHFKQGRYRESRGFFERAAACDPGRLEFRVKAALCERLERTGPPAPTAASPR